MKWNDNSNVEWKYWTECTTYTVIKITFLIGYYSEILSNKPLSLIKITLQSFS